MRKLFFLLLAVCVVSGFAAVQNTQHDLSSGSGAAFNAAAVQSNNVDRICVFCHTPHQPAGVTTDPLWNHQLVTTGTYGVYTSVTFNGDDAGLADGQIAEVRGSGTSSELCMSCHDGTIGVGNLYNNPGAVVPSNNATTIGAANPAYVGTNLTNDHPVNFQFDAELRTADGGTGLNDPAGAAIAALLDSTGYMHCSSCHDPHDDTFGSFMVMNNANSALCTTCHNK